MLRIALCQINVTVGDLDGNRSAILRAAEEAVKQGADLAIFPELALCGYPPEDLLLKPRFSRCCREVIESLALELPVSALIGIPHAEGGLLYNAAALVAEGGIKAIYRKQELPNYAVFDEKRYFSPGDSTLLLTLGGHSLGVLICEDAWTQDGPAARAVHSGAEILLCLNASPYHRAKHREREAVISALCRRLAVSFVYCNLIGGQDELVFDGGSFVMDAEGRVTAHGPQFKEEVFSVDLPESFSSRRKPVESGKTCVVQVEYTPEEKRQHLPLFVPSLPSVQEVYECLVLGVRDYVGKNGFRDVVIGSSGGVDSALTVCIAVEALGPEHVTCVSMPSRYSSEATKGDAGHLAENLGTSLLTIPIHDTFMTLQEGLSSYFAGRKPDLTEENLQARIRGVYLMALANKFGWLVLNTSNKSEAAVGYGTIYGDMIGAYGVLKDVFKTAVFALARYVNERHGWEVLPVSVIERAPSAELRFDQKDSDSLPEYDLLDQILEAYIEEDQPVDEIIASGFPAEVVKRVVHLTDINEWKRRQSVPGVRVTPRAFGKDRRMPITNRYSG